MFGDHDLGLYDLRRRGKRDLRRLENRNDFAIEQIDVLDHSMFGLRAREEVWTRVAPFVLGQRSDPTPRSDALQPSPETRS